jgi:hypothetical protein
VYTFSLVCLQLRLFPILRILGGKERLSLCIQMSDTFPHSAVFFFFSFPFFLYRQELLGIARDKNADDIDWEKVAGKPKKQATVPPAIKIPVSELLNSKNKKKVQQLPLKEDLEDDEPVDDSQSRPAQVMCYVTNWSAKRDGIGRFNVEDIDGKLCTHVVYAFAKLKVRVWIAHCSAVLAVHDINL